MKILFLHALAEPELGGGAEMTLWTLMRGLRDSGHEPVLLATSDNAGLGKTEREGITVWQGGIRNVYWPYHKKRPAAPWRLVWHALDSYNRWMQGYIRKVVRYERPDVASLHNLPGWSVASWRTLADVGCPTVQVLHDYYSICVRSTMRCEKTNCARQCIRCRAFRVPHGILSRKVNAVVGVSKYVLDAHRKHGYFAGVPIQRVIHNARAAEALGLDTFVREEPHMGVQFGYIGGLSEAKGVETLIKAYQAAELPGSKLLIAGSGKEDYERYLRAKVDDDHIRLLGYVSPREFYPQVDVVVVPSLWNEPLGMVVAEALAFGKPVIGSRRGGIPEMIRDGENGLLFEPEAPGELKAALEALQDDTLRARLTELARPSARPFLDMAGWVDTYEALYREVVSESAVSPQAGS